MWKRLGKKLVIHEPRGKPFRSTSIDDIREFETQNKLRFPHSYKAFATEVGAGEFCGYYIVYTPDFGLEKLWDEVIGLDLFKRIYSNPEFIDRMIPFGVTIGGDVVAWDPSDITSLRPLEYGVYVLPRENTPIVRLCNDFKTYVHSVMFGHGLMVALYGAPNPDWKIEFTMKRIRPTRRLSRYSLPAA